MNFSDDDRDEMIAYLQAINAEMLEALEHYSAMTRKRGVVAALSEGTNQTGWREYISPVELEQYENAVSIIAKARGE